MRTNRTTIPRIYCLLTLMALSCVWNVSSCQADNITFDLTATNSTDLGGTIAWQIFATVSDYQAVVDNNGILEGNFGISTISVDLFNSGPDALTPASAIGIPFADYSFLSMGTPNNTSLIEINATLFTQSNALVEARDPILGGTVQGSGPLLLARGSFTPTSVGTFDLNITAGSANDFFKTAGSFVGTGEDFTTAFNSTSYSVTAIPEPSSALMLGCIAGLTFVRRRRNRATVVGVV